MLEIEALSVDFGPGSAFSTHYDLTVPTGALCAVVGPSGGGKTTLLHAIAGFGRVVSGAVRFDGRDITCLPPAARPLSILFQEHNLFPHLDAAANVGLGIDPGLRLGVTDKERISRALAEVDLAGFETRRPGELSGGQRQRVALARALVRDKPLMLLDEPFGALDPDLRADMIALVDHLRAHKRLTVLMSIHTPGDVAGIADLVATVRDGRVTVAASA